METIRARLQAARSTTSPLLETWIPNSIFCNADIRVGEIRRFCKLQDEGQTLMRAAMSQLNLSERAYHRTQSMKLARTNADWIAALHLRLTKI